MKRRKFLKNGVSGAVFAGVLPLVSNPLFAAIAKRSVKQPIGFQSFVLREKIGADITGTLKKMKGYGYEMVEMCSPSGYIKYGFEPLAKYSGDELKKMIADTGMKCTSSHFTMQEMKDNLEERIDFAQQMGLKHMVCSGGLSSPTLDEIEQKCDTMNVIGDKIKNAGMVAGYHNHASEFEDVFDKRPSYDYMLDWLDPNLVKMQFQTQVITLGYKGADYFKKYPGRFISAHLQDYSPQDTTKEIVLGQGISDWKEFFAASKTGGLEAVYVEMESNPGTLEGSVKYLKNL